MDALFGLPWKKAAGVSYDEPLQGTLFFGNQLNVDKFVESYTGHSVSKTKVRSVNLYKTLIISLFCSGLY